jgi:hypothetical protein
MSIAFSDSASGNFFFAFFGAKSTYSSTQHYAHENDNQTQHHLFVTRLIQIKVPLA